MYKSVYPISQKSTYTSSDNLDFVLSFAGNAIVQNSVRLSGILTAYANQTAGTRITTEKIYLDNYVGAHSLFDSIVVEMGSKGIVESNSYYPRWVKMKTTATVPNSKLVANSSTLCELMTTDYHVTNKLLNDDVPFTIKPDICLNNMFGPDATSPCYIPWSKSGDITLSMRVTLAKEALFGPSMAAASGFAISNLVLEYMIVPEMQGMQTPNMLIRYTVKQVINSTNSVVRVSLPSESSKVSCSFLPVSEENGLTTNNLELARPPSVNKLYWSFADSTSAIISYPLESPTDIIYHYLKSFVASSSKNGCSVQKLSNGNFFGIGMDFGMSLKNQSIGLNLMSSVDSTIPFYIYMFFTGAIGI